MIFLYDFLMISKNYIPNLSHLFHNYFSWFFIIISHHQSSWSIIIHSKSCFSVMNWSKYHKNTLKNDVFLDIEKIFEKMSKIFDFSNFKNWVGGSIWLSSLVNLRYSKIQNLDQKFSKIFNFSKIIYLSSMIISWPSDDP